MELSAAEGRVLGCLIAQQAAAADSHALSLDEVRFACNQEARGDVVAFDDRTVDDALVALKSKGLARFVLAGRNVGPVRYRHRADERWRLGQSELAVLAALLLGGPQTLDEVRAAVGRQQAMAPAPPPPPGEEASEPSPEVDVEAALDALAGRTPTPFAVRVAAPSWGDETLWAEVLTGRPTDEDLYRSRQGRPMSPEPRLSPPPPTPLTLAERQATLAEVVDRLAGIERRLAAIEVALATLTERGERERGERGPGSRRPPQESSRLMR